MGNYAIAGDEPRLDDVMQDPIVRHLRHYDGLSPDEWPELAEAEFVYERPLAA